MSKCDFCEKTAILDGKTVFGPWAYMCKDCFRKYGIRTPGLWSELKKEEKDVQSNNRHKGGAL